MTVGRMLVQRMILICILIKGIKCVHLILVCLFSLFKLYYVLFVCLRVSLGDVAGTVADGDTPGSLDLDFTDETKAVTMHFDGFSSQSCGGIARYEWAVGLGEAGEEREEILPFTEEGVVVTGTGGSGYAQVS